MTRDWTVYQFETLSSTQDIARQYLDEGRQLPFVIRADMQTASRGRSGNKWVSHIGNLLTTIVVPLDKVEIRSAGQYSFLTAVALMDSLADCGVDNAQNKWPNDILVDGRKIAGILLESDMGTDGYLNALLIGVGVNIAHAPDGAVFLNEFVQPTDAEDFLSRFLVHIQRNLDMIAADGFASIRQRWLSRAFGIGTEIRVRLPQETFYGEFLGLDEGGALLVKVSGEDKLRVIHSGEVFFGR
jgi:BirA family biotin operon repressor/biotin-[acetyl-CoA-carboxylase] ligase